MQADTEHQQDHADLGQFRRKRLVRDQAGREGSERDAGDQVTDDRRQAQAVCSMPAR
jgi:hypothetical protein